MINGSMSQGHGHVSVAAQRRPVERPIGGIYRVRYRVRVDTPIVSSLLRYDRSSARSTLPWFGTFRCNNSWTMTFLRTSADSPSNSALSVSRPAVERSRVRRNGHKLPTDGERQSSPTESIHAAEARSWLYHLVGYFIGRTYTDGANLHCFPSGLSIATWR
jgi:hypothetical protein